MVNVAQSSEELRASGQEITQCLVVAHDSLTRAIGNILPPVLAARQEEYRQARLLAKEQKKKQQTDFSKELMNYQKHFGGLAPVDTRNIFSGAPPDSLNYISSFEQAQEIYVQAMKSDTLVTLNASGNDEHRHDFHLPVMIVERWLPGLPLISINYSVLADNWFSLLCGQCPNRKQVREVLQLLSDNIILIRDVMAAANATSGAWASMFSLLSILPTPRVSSFRKMDYYALLGNQLALITSGNPAVEAIAEIRRNFCRIAMGGSTEWAFITRQYAIADTVLRPCIDAIPFLQQRAGAFCEPWTQFLDSRVVVVGSAPFYISSIVPRGCSLENFNYETWRDNYLEVLPHVDINLVMRPEAMLQDVSPCGAARRYAEYLFQAYRLRFPDSYVRVFHGKNTIVLAPEYGRKIVICAFLTQSEGAEFASLARTNFGCGVMHVEMHGPSNTIRYDKLRDYRWPPPIRNNGSLDEQRLAASLRVNIETLCNYEQCENVGTYSTVGLLPTDEKKNNSEEEKRARCIAAANALAEELQVTASAGRNESYQLTEREIAKAEARKRAKGEQKKRDIQQARAAMMGANQENGDHPVFVIHLSDCLWQQMSHLSTMSVDELQNVQEARMAQTMHRIRFADGAEHSYVDKDHWKARISKENKTITDTLKRMDYRTFTEFLFCTQPKQTPYHNNPTWECEDWRV